LQACVVACITGQGKCDSSSKFDVRLQNLDRTGQRAIQLIGNGEQFTPTTELLYGGSRTVRPSRYSSLTMAFQFQAGRSGTVLDTVSCEYPDGPELGRTDVAWDGLSLKCLGDWRESAQSP